MRLRPDPSSPIEGSVRSRRGQIAEKVALERVVNRLDRIQLSHCGCRLALSRETGHRLAELRSVEPIERIVEPLQRLVCRSLTRGRTQKVERRPDARLV